MRFVRGLLVALLVPAIALAGPFSRFRDKAAEDTRTVKDLAYGEVLFHFYQDEHFDALTRLLAGLTRDELPNHARDADLLLGALYLSYGQHRIAGAVFDQVLNDVVDQVVRDRVWYFLARVWYQRGYHEDAELALTRISAPLEGGLEPERQMLSAQVLMALGRFEEALAVLRAWEKPRDRWVGFTLYNIGVALVRLGRIDEGAAVLDEVGRLEPDEDDSEIAALRDRANVALGYAWLQAGQPEQARAPLQRVRLNGPFSNKALLGIGWADAEGENFRAALAAWLELRGRDLLDSAVQEAYLAVPYAYSQLGADKQAADHYVDAIEAYNAEIERLQSTIESIDDGELLAELLDEDEMDGSGWYWRLDDLPDSEASRYLYELMASNQFQEGLKSYRDVVYLSRNLDAWAESLTAFDDILDTRQRAFDQRLPVINDSLSRVNLDAMSDQRLRLEARVAEIESREDIVALATGEQQRQWQDLTSIESGLETLGDADPRAPDFRDKHRFLKGLLYWNMRRDYSARLWAAQRGLRELDRELKTAARAHYDVTSQTESWPEDFAGLTSRIGALRPRVDELRATTAATQTAQKDYLESVAIDLLAGQRDRLRTYMLQARFSLAAIYDRATAGTAAPTVDDSLIAGVAR